MSSNMSAIGFDTPDIDEFHQLVQHAAREGEEITSPRGRYKRWVAGGGAELWVPLYKDTAGVVPAFASPTVVRLAVEELERTGAKSPLEGIAIGALPPREDSYPVPWAFELAGFDLHAAELGEGAVVDIRVAGFAASVAVRAANQEIGPDWEGMTFEAPEITGLADQALIPVWSFEDDADAICAMSGIVLEAETRCNGYSGAEFHHIVIDTLGAAMSVVVAPDDLVELPTIGDVLETTCWMSGIVERVVEPRPRKRRLFRR